MVRQIRLKKSCDISLQTTEEIQFFTTQIRYSGTTNYSERKTSTEYSQQSFGEISIGFVNKNIGNTVNVIRLAYYYYVVRYSSPHVKASMKFDIPTTRRKLVRRRYFVCVGVIRNNVCVSHFIYFSLLLFFRNIFHVDTDTDPLEPYCPFERMDDMRTHEKKTHRLRLPSPRQQLFGERVPVIFLYNLFIGKRRQEDTSAVSFDFAEFQPSIIIYYNTIFTKTAGEALGVSSATTFPVSAHSRRQGGRERL